MDGKCVPVALNAPRAADPATMPPPAYRDSFELQALEPIVAHHPVFGQCHLTAPQNQFGMIAVRFAYACGIVRASELVLDKTILPQRQESMEAHEKIERLTNELLAALMVNRSVLAEKNTVVGEMYALIDEKNALIAEKQASAAKYEELKVELESVRSAHAKELDSIREAKVLSDAKAVIPVTAAAPPIVRPTWIADSRPWPLRSSMEALLAAAANKGQYPCSLCSETQSVPHSYADINWCDKCLALLQSSDCGKRHRENDGKTYFEDPMSPQGVLVKYWLKKEKEGCIICNWRRIYPECVKCGKRAQNGSLQYGAFTCGNSSCS